MELIDGIVPDLHAIDADAVAVELHQIESSEDGGILVLLPALETDLLPLELVGQLGHLARGEPDAAPLAHGRDDRHYDGRGASETGSGRSLRLKEHPESVGDLEVIGYDLDEIHVPVQGQRAVAQLGAVFPVVRGMDRHGMIVGRSDGAVRITVDRRIENGAPFLGGIRLDVCAASGQPYSQWCSGPVVNPIHPITSGPPGSIPGSRMYYFGGDI